MKPTKFKEQTKTLYGRGEIKPLPVFSNGVVCVSCWKLNFVERLRGLIFGRIWVQVRSGKTQPAIALFCWKKGFK